MQNLCPQARLQSTTIKGEHKVLGTRKAKGSGAAAKWWRTFGWIRGCQMGSKCISK
jgi:hypothetical protein